MATFPAAAAETSSWADLFREGRGVYTVILNLGVVLHATNIFVISVVMPSVVRDVGGAALYAWPSMLYLVGTIMGASSGSVVRVAIGRRKGYALAGVGFMLGAAASGLAPSMELLIAAHFLTGLGGGLLLAQSMALVRELFEGSLRTRALAVISSTWSIAALLGPFVGGIFAQMDFWRGAFWVMVPITLGFVLVAWRAIPASAAEAMAVRLPYRRLLLLGLGVLAVGTTGQVDGSTIRLSLFVLSVLLVWMAIRLDAGSPHPMFPSRVFSVFSSVGTAYWVNFCMAITHIGIALFMPLALQELRGISPLWAGWFGTIMSIGWTVGSVAVAGLPARLERDVMIAGMAIATAANLFLGLWVESASLWLIGFVSFALGIGIGIANVHVNAFTLAVARPGEGMVTASAMPAVRSLGIAFGAAGMGFVANWAGLGEGISRETVASAMFWIFSSNALIPLACGLLIWRMVALRNSEPIND